MASSSSSSHEFVGFGSRLAAFAVDALCLYVVIAPLAAFGIDGPLVWGLLPTLATIAFWRLYGATPGKMALSARIIDARTGAAPSSARLAARLAAYLLSAAPLFLGFAWIAIDRRKQAWHDKIAGTAVVYDDD